MLSVKEKLRLLFFSPEKFYKKVSGEKSYLSPLLFYVILLIIVSTFGIIFRTTRRINYGRNGYFVYIYRDF